MTDVELARYAPADIGQPKEDVERVGTTFDGTPIYRFRFGDDPAFTIGLMARDVPHAVTETGGIDVLRATAKAVEAI